MVGCDARSDVSRSDVSQGNEDEDDHMVVEGEDIN